MREACATKPEGIKLHHVTKRSRGQQHCHTVADAD